METDELPIDVETMPCAICGKSGADTVERTEDTGKRVWYHAACLAVPLMGMEDAAHKYLRRLGVPDTSLPDIAGKMIRRARKIAKK